MATISKAWAFTLNNYSEEEYTSVLFLEHKFLIVGREVGESGTPHLQGFIRFEKTKRFNAVKLLIPRAHIESAAGSDEQNIKYCSKEDPEPFMHGVPSSQGKRTDLDKAIKSIGKHGLHQAVLENPKVAVRYSKGLQFYAKHLLEDLPKPVPEIRWYYGSTGTGKSRSAYEEFPNAWRSNGTLQWCDGYEGQPHVIVDDFRKDFCTFHYLLNFTDRYPINVPIKGGFVPFIPEVIIFTSPYHPKEVFATNENKDQFLRRLSIIKCFDSDSVPDILDSYPF